jgi:DNA-binding response OmpR family regulator
MLPGKGGQDICRNLRSEGIDTPILMLTSKNEEIDKVLGLETGADDYVTKPFSIHELQARIKALLRRASPIKREIDTFSFGNVHLDFIKLEALKNKKPVKLSAKEFEILKFFIKHEGEMVSRDMLLDEEGEMVSRDMLLDEVWGYDIYPTTRTVDNYILSLRKKIENDPANPQHLLTLHRAGYKFRI